MKSINALIFLSVILFSGCTNTYYNENLEELNNKLPHVKLFIEENPSSNIIITYWNIEEINRSLENITNECNKTIPLSPMLKLEGIKNSSNKITAWIDAVTKYPICEIKAGGNCLPNEIKCDELCTVPICENNLDCDDFNPETSNFCIQPGTCSSYCQFLIVEEDHSELAKNYPGFDGIYETSIHTGDRIAGNDNMWIIVYFEPVQRINLSSITLNKTNHYYEGWTDTYPNGMSAVLNFGEVDNRTDMSITALPQCQNWTNGKCIVKISSVIQNGEVKFTFPANLELSPQKLYAFTLMHDPDMDGISNSYNLNSGWDSFSWQADTNSNFTEIPGYWHHFSGTNIITGINAVLNFEAI